MALSSDGDYLVTAGADKGMKIFHVQTFDMIKMFRLDFEPAAAAWVYDKRHGEQEAYGGDQMKD